MFLEGETLFNFCIGPYNVNFSFENCNLSAEFALIHVQSDGTSVRYDIQQMTSAPPIKFQKCLGKKVVALEVKELRLDLKFETGDVIQIESDLGSYESGNIEHAGGPGKEPVYFVF